MVDWKLNLANYFEELRILRESKQEALDNFNQFCEFIAEPAFESLEDAGRAIPRRFPPTSPSSWTRWFGCPPSSGC